ncbi:MAG: TRAFs-binding domain-containing protein [Bacteroidota bacterium]
MSAADQRPLCFVIMPFGDKPDPSGRPDIDFDRVYHEALRPAIEEAGMEPIRADGERTGGIIHKPMFERLLLCDYALADLTTANANVLYELGVRHAARPRTTLTLFAQHQKIPFDVSFLRSLPYDLGDDNAFGDAEVAHLRQAVAERLRELRSLTVAEAPVDSPLFQLLAGWKPGDIARLKTDVFRERTQANERYKRQLEAIREKHKEDGAAARADLATFRAQLPGLDAVEAATVVDLMLTYRAVGDPDGMIDLVEAMPAVLQRQVLVREQLGFAYNRRAGRDKNSVDRAKALQILEGVDEQQGPSSETLGLIGRIHKDQWKEAREAGDLVAAEGHLDQAIDAYRRGFLADQRDAYPGINLMTLLDIQGEDDSLAEKERLLPVVRFAVERRLATTTPDYWDHATMLELAVLDDEPKAARRSLAKAAAVIRETWEPGTTANNLRMIEQARAERGADTTWLEPIITDLEARSRS